MPFFFNVKRKKNEKMCDKKERESERENARERERELFSVYEEKKVSLSNKYTTIENTTD